MRVKKRIAISIVLAVLLLATAAGASIPSATGIYTACVTPAAPSGPAKGVAAVTLLDTSLNAKCPSGTSLVTWNQTGPKGDKGDKGDQGPQGSQGEKGDKGDKGDTGATGPQGAQGIQGEKGDKGSQGPQGIQGEKGDKGDTGPTGPAGADGVSVTSTALAPGDANCLFGGARFLSASGFAFACNGAAGATGLQGPQGAQGPQGEKGDKGDKGDPGEPGPTYTAGACISISGVNVISNACPEHSPGFGLTMNGLLLEVDPAAIQRRVTGVCAAGNAIQAIASDGTVTCQAAAAGLALPFSGSVSAPGTYAFSVRNTAAGNAIAGFGGENSAGVDGIGSGSGGRGVEGVGGSNGDGVVGFGRGSSGRGIVGVSAANTGDGTSTRAAQFLGDVSIIGSLSASGTKAFRIDHPLDPAHKFLVHAAVEAPAMVTFYDGIVETDARGVGVVTLPSYFEALNRDFRYQLTVIGTFAQAIVKSEIHDNRFVVATSEPNVRVSWQVTAVRNDPYARSHPLVVEQPKTGSDLGRYAYPQGYGVRRSLRIAALTPTRR